MRSFVKNDGPAGRPDFREPQFSVFRPNRWESEERELTCCKTRGGQRRDRCVRAGDGLNPKPGLRSSPNQLVSWIRNSWGARVRHERDVLPLLQTPEKFRDLLMFVVFVTACGGCGDAVTGEQV